MKLANTIAPTTTAVLLCLGLAIARGQGIPNIESLRIDPPQPAGDAPRNVLSRAEWERVDAAVARALVWLAHQQQATGAFPSIDTGQPGVTALCAMAFVSHGHLPDDDLFGKQLRSAVDFTISCQQENGLVSLCAPAGPLISRNVAH